MRLFQFGLGVLLAEAAALAAAPTVDWIYPAGGTTNTTFQVTIGAKGGGWPYQAWSDDAAIKLKALEKENTFEVQIAKTAAIGPHLLRFYNAEGASKLRTFQVGKTTEFSEKEPDENFKTAQDVPAIPAVLNGRFDKGGDVDTFALNLKAGRTIVAAMDCYGLASPVDPLLRLFDDAGHEIAFSHDARNLDPLIAWKIPKDGKYFVQAAGFGHPPEANVQFTGSSACVYRLTLTDGPFINYVFPPAVPAGSSKTELHGWNMPVTEISLNTSNEPVRIAPEQILNTAALQLLAGLPYLEKEPNNATNEALKVTLPCLISGRLGSRGDIDTFAFEAKEGEPLVFNLESASFGFPVDGRLTVLDATGKELSQNDDRSGDRDPHIELNFKGNPSGTYFVQVSDIFHQGGDDHVYQLAIRKRSPDFTAQVDKDSLILQQGKTAELKVTVQKLEGFDQALTLKCIGLPEGVKLENPEFAASTKEQVLKFSAAENAAISNQPLRLSLTGASLKHDAKADLRAKDLGGPRWFDNTSELWITVTKK